MSVRVRFPSGAQKPSWIFPRGLYIFSHTVLQLSLPKAVKVAIFVYCYWLGTTHTDLSFRLVGQIYTDSAILCLYINEGDVVLRKHRMRDAADVDPDSAVINAGDDWDMLFSTCVYGIRYEFFHLFSTAHDRNLGVDKFNDYIAAMAAFIKSCSHNIFCFIQLQHLQKSCAVNGKSLQTELFLVI